MGELGNPFGRSKSGEWLKQTRVNQANHGTPPVKTECLLYFGGWPKEANVFDEADAIVLNCDGGDGHPAIQGDHLKMLAAAMKRGVGLGLIHYAVEVPKDKGGPDFLEWAVNSSSVLTPAPFAT